MRLSCCQGKSSRKLGVYHIPGFFISPFFGKNPSRGLFTSADLCIIEDMESNTPLSHKGNETMKKLVTELTAGDLIDPPAGEKVWLWRDGVKRRYTVTQVVPGKVTKKGRFVKIYATVPSPYADQNGDTDRPSDISCQMIETKSVKVHN